MKQLFAICLFSLMTFGLMAQSDKQSARKTQPNPKAQSESAAKKMADKSKKNSTCAVYVIDYKGAKNDLVSEVWNPAVDVAKPGGTAVNIAVTNDKKQAVKGWNQCSLENCNDLTWLDGKGQEKQIQRRTRKQVSNEQVCATTQVIDLTNFGQGSYVIQAIDGTRVIEKKISVPKNGLAKPEPTKQTVSGAGN